MVQALLGLFSSRMEEFILSTHSFCKNNINGLRDDLDILLLLLFFFNLFIYLFMAVLGLRFCARAPSSCGKRGPLFIAVRGPLSRPLLLWSTGSRRAGSVIVAHGPSCSAACGIFPDQGLNPCPLHWQADSQPLCHQGSPGYIINKSTRQSWVF